MLVAEFDLAIRLTDILTIIALLAGPIIAVGIADYRQNRQVQRGQKEWIFRTLITTKSSPLAMDHINAINLTGLIFRKPDTLEKDVIEAWKLYRAHLDKGQVTSPQWWGPRQLELLDELLYKIALALKVPLSVSEIKNSTSYYPAGIAKAEAENNRIRELWLQVLENSRALPITNEIQPQFDPQTLSPPAEPSPSMPMPDLPTGPLRK